MDLIRHILPPSRALVVHYQSESIYSLRMITTRNGLSGLTVREDRIVDVLADAKSELSSGPVVVVLSGYGVIRKSRVEDEVIVNRVTMDEEIFLYTATSASAIRFVRRAQIASLEDELEQLGGKVVEIRCSDNMSERPYTKGERATGLFARQIGWVELIKPSPRGSVLCMLICRRIKFPLLSVMLFALLFNFVNDRSLKTEYARNGAQLSVLSSEIGRQSDDRQSVDRLRKLYGQNLLPYGYALIADRIATLVPKDVSLSQLAIRPLKKPIQEGQEPELVERMCLVAGQGVRVEAISRFLDALDQEKFTDRLKLRSIVHNTESGMFHFVAQIEL